MMQAVFRALKPGGRLVIIDGEGPAGKPEPNITDCIPFPPNSCAKKSAATGLSSKRAGRGSTTRSMAKKFYFLIFERPLPNSTPKTQG